MPYLLALFAFFSALAAPGAHAWWNEDWAGRRSVTFAPPEGEATDAPVLVRLHTGNFDFLSAKADGSDLRVVAADDATELKFHIEKWDDLNQLALVWVRVPRLAPKSQVWLYFGNEAATPAADARASYDAASAAYHFAEAGGLPADSGPNARAATAFSGTRAPASFAGAGAKFDGAQSLALALAPAAETTLAFWIKPEALAGLLAQATGLTATLTAAGLQVTAGAASVNAPGLQAGAWQHVALVAGASLKVYVNGQLAGEAAGATPPAGTLTLAAGFTGELDAVQVIAAARDAAWIAAQAAQGQGGTLVVVGAEELAGGGGSGIWGTLFAALTLDGWVAIGILAVMLVIAVWIMAVKTAYVNRVDAANRRFMVKFRELSTDLAGIDKAHALAVEFKQSSLYRLYHVAAVELAQRFPDTDAAHLQDKRLSAPSLAAIRASLDTGLVKETTRMNSLMVLLTIAISGGPFIGLLGTVLGVMITFAVIAATGDVNVASIAPGIAAALMATAAGMAVAIPSLFGYNYLNSRIKAVTSDLRVFNDELITKLAEHYSQ